MGWFSGKYDDENDASKAGTISDKDYRALQSRAAKANPKHADTFSREAGEARQRGADNYQKRWWN